jgi:hypothetical protein
MYIANCFPIGRWNVQYLKHKFIHPLTRIFKEVERERYVLPVFLSHFLKFYMHIANFPPSASWVDIAESHPSAHTTLIGLSYAGFFALAQ